MAQTILVLEDEAVVAMDIVDELSDAGWKVMGPAGSIEKARRLIDSETPGAALLDINLHGSNSFTLARELLHKGVQVVFLTGYTAEAIPEEFSECPVIAKPVDMHSLSAVLNSQRQHSSSI